jgi:hypothetical protein
MAKHVLEIVRGEKTLRVESSSNLESKPIFSQTKFAIKDEEGEKEITIDNSEVQHLVNFFTSLLPCKTEAEVEE